MKTVTTGQLRNMAGQEGLVLQGCGGDPQEWLDGINDLLTKEGMRDILLDNFTGYLEYKAIIESDEITGTKQARITEQRQTLLEELR